MNGRSLFAYLLMAFLAAPVLSVAAQPDADSLPDAPVVKESSITQAVKTKLAGTRIGGLTQVEVDTEANGTVWLSGTAPTQEAADRAVDIARNAEGVVQVKSNIVVAREAR
jgi:hyperosmotically inducible protein